MSSEDAPGVFLIVEPTHVSSQKLKLPTRSLQLLCTGQVAIGLVSIVCQASILFLFASYLDNLTTSEGIYCGLLYIASGLVGLVATRKVNSGLITASMVLSIISTIFGLHLLIFSSINIMHWSHPWKRSYYKAKYSAPAWLFSLLYTLLLVCSLLEVCLSLACSTIFCKAFNCCSKVNRNTRMLYLPREGEEAGRRDEEHFSAVYATEASQKTGGFEIGRGGSGGYLNGGGSAGYVNQALELGPDLLEAAAK